MVFVLMIKHKKKKKRFSPFQVQTVKEDELWGWREVGGLQWESSWGRKASFSPMPRTNVILIAKTTSAFPNITQGSLRET